MFVKNMVAQALMSKALSMLIRYGSVGIINTLTGAAVMVAFAYLGFHYTIYTAAGYVVGFITSYVLNGLYTFKLRRLSYRGFAYFLAINGALLLGVELLQILLIEVLRLSELFSVIVGMIVYMFVGFFLNRTIVYRVA